jgi:signal peptidase II
VMRSRFYILTLLVWIVDHLTKWVVRSNLDLGEGLTVIPGMLRLCYVQNTGVAFGLFHQVQSVWKPYVLASMAVVAVVVIVVYSLRVPPDRSLLQAALAITMGGILGNFVDRLVHGYVIDFIELHLQDAFQWPTFNVADTAITVGIVLLLVDTVRNPEHKEEAGLPG